jgi:hypothetical protein
MTGHKPPKGPNYVDLPDDFLGRIPDPRPMFFADGGVAFRAAAEANARYDAAHTEPKEQG